MKDFQILRILDKLESLFEKLGVDYAIMRKILQVKLLMDGRRVPTVLANNSKNADADNGNKFMKSLWIYILMGLILIPFVIMKHNYIYQMGTVFAIVMFFIMSSMISDFSSVLLDIRDKNIIGTKPVNAKTLRTAKTIHVAIYLSYTTLALTGPALLVSLFVQGILFFLMFLVSLLLLNLFIIVLTSLVYLFVLRFFDGEKLKDIINYIQIVLSLVLMIGYQLVGRLFNVVDLKIEFIPGWWQYLLAPIWFSAPFQMLKKSEFNSTYIIFAIMAVVVPITAIAFYIRLMPLFEKYLQKLSNSSQSRNKHKGKPAQLLARLMCRSKAERIFFSFAWDMMRNERDFKLKVYPTLGFSMFFPFIFLIQRVISTPLQVVSQGRSYFFIYFCGMMLPTAVMMLKYSERYKGAWIYKALPIQDIVPVFKGTIKAFLTKLFIPMFLMEAIIFTAVFGMRIIPDMVIVLLNLMIFNILCFMVMEKSLPFSKPYEAAQQSSGMVVIPLGFLLAAMAGIHYALTSISFGVYICVLLSLIINLVLWKFAYRISPEKLV